MWMTLQYMLGLQLVWGLYWHVIMNCYSYSMDSKDTVDCRFFIVVEERFQHIHVHPGSLCYMSSKNYESVMSKPKELRELSVCCMGSYNKDRVRMSDLSALSTEEAALLYSLEGDTDRLKWYKEGTALSTALGLTVDTPVNVEGYGHGVIRYVGPIVKHGPSQAPDPISARLFGIELQVWLAYYQGKHILSLFKIYNPCWLSNRCGTWPHMPSRFNALSVAIHLSFCAGGRQRQRDGWQLDERALPVWPTRQPRYPVLQNPTHTGLCPAVPTEGLLPVSFQRPKPGRQGPLPERHNRGTWDCD